MSATAAQAASKPTVAELAELATKKREASAAPAVAPCEAGTTAARLSVFHRITHKAPSGEITMRDFVGSIRDGTHAEAVGKVRTALAHARGEGLPPDEIKKRVNPVKKRELEAGTLSGRVTNGNREQAFQEGRFEHSGWLQIDIDAADLAGADGEEVRDRIGKDPHILAAALSPTGEGVKAIMRIPVCETPDEHKRAFLAADAYMLATYGLSLDKSTKDPGRVCYVTHDPQATSNGATVPLEVAKWAPEELAEVPRPTPAAKREAPRAGTTPATPGAIILRTGNGTRETTPEDVRDMLAAIPPRPAYDVWLRIASAVWDATDEATGTALLNEWSPEEKPGEYAEKFKYRLADVRTGTLVMLAKEHGWTPPRSDGKADKGKSKGGDREPADPDAFREMLRTRQFVAAIVPPRPVPILMLGDKVISTPGNLTNIQAQAKAGKSAVVGAIIAAMFNGNRQGADTLEFSAENEAGKLVLHFDTEQSRFDHDALIRRAMTRARVDEPPPWFHSYCLTDLAVLNRRAVINCALNDSAGAGVFAVIIDGMADLCCDPNDAEESFGLVDALHAAAIKHDCAIVTVVHENPGSMEGKMRGHLGSQLERKAETPLRLAKDAANGITTIWTERARHCHIPKEQGYCFSWSDTQGMHVSRGRAGTIKATEKREKLTEMAKAAFGTDATLSNAALLGRICDVENVKESTAKTRIKNCLAEGIMGKTAGGSYMLIAPVESGEGQGSKSGHNES